MTPPATAGSPRYRYHRQLDSPAVTRKHPSAGRFRQTRRSVGRDGSAARSDAGPIASYDRATVPYRPIGTYPYSYHGHYMYDRRCRCRGEWSRPMRKSGGRSMTAPNDNIIIIMKHVVGVSGLCAAVDTSATEAGMRPCYDTACTCTSLSKGRQI